MAAEREKILPGLFLEVFHDRLWRRHFRHCAQGTAHFTPEDDGGIMKKKKAISLQHRNQTDKELFNAQVCTNLPSLWLKTFSFCPCKKLKAAFKKQKHGE